MILGATNNIFHKIDLFAPVLKSNLQTFGKIVKSKKISATAVIVEADRGLFAGMVIIAQH